VDTPSHRQPGANVFIEKCDPLQAEQEFLGAAQHDARHHLQALKIEIRLVKASLT